MERRTLLKVLGACGIGLAGGYGYTAVDPWEKDTAKSPTEADVESAPSYTTELDAVNPERSQLQLIDQQVSFDYEPVERTFATGPFKSVRAKPSGDGDRLVVEPRDNTLEELAALLRDVHSVGQSMEHEIVIGFETVQLRGGRFAGVAVLVGVHPQSSHVVVARGGFAGQARREADNLEALVFGDESK